jgi:uncharacterized protein (AIM24 family)
MTDTATSYTCPYCQMESTGVSTSCPTCGAPVNIALRTTASGWTELPPVADMAHIQMGRSSAQIMGRLVPAAEVALSEGDGVYFPHPSLLWREPGVNVTDMPLRRAWTRVRAGLPLVMLEARGPGRISLSHYSPGELLAIPLQPGAAIDVREHQMVFATLGVGYDWYDSNIWFNAREQSESDSSAAGSLLNLAGGIAGLAGDDRRRDERNEVQTYFPVGRHIDRFQAGEQPGAVVVQVGGNAFLRTLGEGESIMVKPPALLYKDPTVAMQMHVEFPAAGVKLWRSWGNRYLWLRLWGPGRVALQSAYDRLEDPGSDFRETCEYTQHLW